MALQKKYPPTPTPPTFVPVALFPFLKQLKEQYNDKPIAVVLDNARYQHCFTVTTFAKSLGIHLLFSTSIFA
jgi:hypothetical protein